MYNFSINILGFTIEFIKTYLLSNMFVKYGNKIRLILSYLAMIFIMLLMHMLGRDYYWEIFVGSIVVIFVLTFATDSWRNFGFVFLSYMFMSAIDIFLSVYLMAFLGLDMEKILGSQMYRIGFDSISFLGILIITNIYNIKHKGEIIKVSKKYLIFVGAGILSVICFSTLMQYMILGEWFESYYGVFAIGLNTLSLISFIAFLVMFFHLRRNAILQVEIKKDEELLNAQEDYYKLVLQKEYETRAFRHDIMNHLYCMKLLLENKEYERLDIYMNELMGEVKSLSIKIKTGNELINAIVNNIAKNYPDVIIKWNGTIPIMDTISQPELCTIFYNVLKNAVEGVEKQSDKHIDVRIEVINNMLSILIKNNAEPPIINNGEFKTNKDGRGHGYGIHNVQRIVRNNNGEIKIKYEDSIFIVDILLPLKAE